jgi:hypothetical protein
MISSLLSGFQDGCRRKQFRVTDTKWRQGCQVFLLLPVNLCKDSVLLSKADFTCLRQVAGHLVGKNSGLVGPSSGFQSQLCHSAAGAFGKLLSLFEPQFPYLEIGNGPVTRISAEFVKQKRILGHIKVETKKVY